MSAETSSRYSGSIPARASSASARRGAARGIALAGVDGSLHARERPVKRGRARALSRRQQGVAARQREPVRLADGRADLDPDRDVEVAHQALDHRRLLRVLLAEVRDVGADDVEQLGDHGRDAVEMAAAAVGALERLGHAADRHGGREARRVDLLGCGREQVVDPELGGELGVALGVTRVRGQVGRVVELGRVDEQRDDDDVALLARAPHQRQMALVERAHRRDETEPVLPARRGCASAARSSAIGCERLHAGWASRAAGDRCCRSRLTPRSGRARVAARARRTAGAGRRPPPATAARWRVTVASSPRATGPVSARSGPRSRPVLDGGADQRHEQLALEPGGGGRPARRPPRA